MLFSVVDGVTTGVVVSTVEVCCSIFVWSVFVEVEVLFSSVIGSAVNDELSDAVSSIAGVVVLDDVSSFVPLAQEPIKPNTKNIIRIKQPQPKQLGFFFLSSMLLFGEFDILVL